MKARVEKEVMPYFIIVFALAITNSLIDIIVLKNPINRLLTLLIGFILFCIFSRYALSSIFY